MGDFLTIPEIIEAAQAKLSQAVWDYASGGAETEATLRRNRSAIERWVFRPKVLVNVRHRDLSTSFLGHRLSMPVMLAPIGSIELFHPDAALAAARAAARMGTISWVSIMTAASLEDVSQAATGPLIFQLYVRNNRDWVRDIVRRVEEAGYVALCLTVDTAVYGRRERDMHKRYDPRWVLPRPNVGDKVTDEEYPSQWSWEDLAWLRALTKLPLILKGVMIPADAVRAVEHGVEVVCVSNHGGRQLDHAPATIDVLAEIVQAVAGRAEVVVDGGFVRGTDILKGLALGARAVLIGKLQCWALAADGEAGLQRALELLQWEISTALALLGVPKITDVGPDCITPAPPI
jgi:isopentenyl diphosphate isomerase/L-lactate dehydrogenase-like FMN-dependent dehydrogenase